MIRQILKWLHKKRSTTIPDYTFLLTTENGKRVIEDLIRMTHSVKAADFSSPNSTYYNLGRQAIVEYIISMSHKQEK